jgi:proline iminopeptidase
VFIRLRDQPIFFDVVGAKLAADGPRLREKPTLLVLHGGPGFDHSLMRTDFDGFADIAQVVYLDHRGNGRSVPSDPATWTLAQWGDDIHDFCLALGIERPIVLGQSFGGMVAQAYATRHPDHPRAVIFSSTAAGMDLARSLRILAETGGPEAGGIAERFWTRGSDEDFAEYVRICMPLYNTTHSPERMEARQRATLRMDVYRHFSLPGREMHRMDFRPVLERVACPALVLAGALDPITPPHLAREIFDALPAGRAELRVFANCGHGAYRDDPAQVMPVIRAFVEEHA